MHWLIVLFSLVNDLKRSACHGVVCTWTHTLRHNSLDITLPIHIANNPQEKSKRLTMEDMKQRFARRLCFRILIIASPMFHLKVGFWTHRHVVNTMVQLYLKRTTRGNTNLVSEWKYTILSITLSNLFCDEISNPFAVDVI